MHRKEGYVSGMGESTFLKYVVMRDAITLPRKEESASGTVQRQQLEKSATKMDAQTKPGKEESVIGMEGGLLEYAVMMDVPTKLRGEDFVLGTESPNAVTKDVPIFPRREDFVRCIG